MTVSSELLGRMQRVFGFVEANRGRPPESSIPTAERTRLVEEYRRTRAIGMNLANRLVRAIPKGTLDVCAKKLGMMAGNTLVFDDMSETAILMDYCIHFGLDQGVPVVSRFAATQPYPPGSQEAAVLEAQCKSRFRLLAVTGVVSGLGVETVDLLRNEPRLIADESFSRSASPGALLAGRIVDMSEFSMTTGAMLPVTPEGLKEIWHRLQNNRENINSIDPTTATFEQEAALSTLIISAALKHHASSRIRYAGPGESEGDEDDLRGLPSSKSTASTSDRRISRNDPCPCGSGRKFKKCCGR
jgi:hypothetical protein